MTELRTGFDAIRALYCKLRKPHSAPPQTKLRKVRITYTLTHREASVFASPVLHKSGSLGRFGGEGGRREGLEVGKTEPAGRPPALYTPRLELC